MSWEHHLPSRWAPSPSASPLTLVSRLSLCLFLLGLASCGRKQVTAPEISPASRSASMARAASFTPGVPTHLQGEIGPGALWSIDVPADWNGDLVVYMHGYSNPAAQIALPAFGPIRDGLLARRFAVVASSYSENGYAVKEGAEQTHQLRGIFAAQVSMPRRTFLFGTSLGGLIGLILDERFPETYDGSLLLSGVVGGSDDEVTYLGDVRVLFDAVYPGRLPGGLENPPAITDVNAQVVVPVLQAIQSNPQGVGIIQSLLRHPLPGNNTTEIVNSLITVLVFAMQGGGDLYDRAHGHSFFDNADWRYTSPLLPSPVIDDINARVARYTRTPDANQYLLHYGEPAGRLRQPTLTLHNSRDPVVPIFHEQLLAAVEPAPWLAQRTIDRYGHVAFTLAEMMDGFDTLVAWVNSGQKPAI